LKQPANNENKFSLVFLVMNLMVILFPDGEFAADYRPIHGVGHQTRKDVEMKNLNHGIRFNQATRRRASACVSLWREASRRGQQARRCN